MYSGRPDPQWKLTESTASRLAEMLASTLRDKPVDPPPAGGLGYRGFLLLIDEMDGLPSELAAFRGVIREGAKRAWPDATGVEGTLLADARERGYGEVLDALGVGGAAAGPALST